MNQKTDNIVTAASVVDELKNETQITQCGAIILVSKLPLRSLVWAEAQQRRPVTLLTPRFRG